MKTTGEIKTDVEPKLLTKEELREIGANEGNRFLRTALESGDRIQKINQLNIINALALHIVATKIQNNIMQSKMTKGAAIMAMKEELEEVVDSFLPEAGKFHKL
jgi:hypothetical protein